jgi:uncharacterized membrane protein
MMYLVLGLALFLAMHSTRIFAEGWRGQTVKRIGPMPWKGLTSVGSLIGFVLIVTGYGLARQAPIYLWQPPFWISHLVSLLMVFALIFLVAAYVPGNMIKAKVGHPMVISVKIWAFAHLLANGTMADLVLFGSFLVWAVLSFRAARLRDKREGVLRAKGNVLATLATLGVGVGVWAWLVFHGHAWLFGVQPIILK